VVVPDVELGQLPVTVFPLVLPDVDTQCPTSLATQGALSLNTVEVHAGGPRFNFITTTYNHPVCCRALIRSCHVYGLDSIINDANESSKV